MVYPLAETPVERQTNTVISAAASQRIALSGAWIVRFSVAAKGLWFKFGSSTVEATAGTAAEGYVPAESILDVAAPRGATHVAIIQAAATAVGSVTTFG